MYPDRPADRIDPDSEKDQARQAIGLIRRIVRSELIIVVALAGATCLTICGSQWLYKALFTVQ